MAAGGIQDQIGGGFARYSVDAEWLVPHFEKMLYDNAQLLSLYTRAWLLTGRDRYREVVANIIGWLEREMRAPGGGYHAALDADSEGVEGKFYVWSLDEVASILTPDELDFAIHHYGITEQGNFEGESILFVARPIGDLADAMGMAVEDVAALRDRVATKLLPARSQRVRPGDRHKGDRRLERAAREGTGRGRDGVRARRLDRTCDGHRNDAGDPGTIR